MMENISFDVVKSSTEVDEHSATLATDVMWKSSAFQNETPFIEEHASVVVYNAEPGIRKMDFEISLLALVPDVELGGSEDVKGYGGFCVRMKLPPGMVFTSVNGAVIPTDEQVRAGAWMDFSARDGTRNDSTNLSAFGLAILCHPSTPNYPAPWILRQKGSMQNIVYPGNVPVKLSMEVPTILRYRLIIHDGHAKRSDIASFQSEYEGDRRIE
jgi:hypothetical protein